MKAPVVIDFGFDSMCTEWTGSLLEFARTNSLTRADVREIAADLREGDYHTHNGGAGGLSFVRATSLNHWRALYPAMFDPRPLDLNPEGAR